MSSYRGAWDGGPPGAEGEYAAPPAAAPATDPWTGVSYSQYGAYDYAAYGAYQYPYEQYYARAGYYQAEAPAAPPSARAPEVTPPPAGRRERSYERASEPRRRYSSSRSRSRSRSYSRERSARKKRRTPSSGSSASDNSYKKKPSSSRRSERSATPPPKTKRSRSRKKSESPGTPDSRERRSRGHSRNTKRHSSVEKRVRDKRRDTMTPPPRNKRSPTPPRGKKTDRTSPSPPRSYKGRERSGSLTPPRSYVQGGTPPRKHRDSSLTPPRSYARAASTASEHSSPRRKPRRARSSSSSASSGGSRRARSGRKHKRKSEPRSRSRSRSRSRRRSPSPRAGPSSSKAKKRSASRSRSRSRGSNTPSDDERRGQFTVSDRKRFWKEHRHRIESKKEAKSPPAELRPPPGALEATRALDVQYGDPPDVVGPNFAELLPPAPAEPAPRARAGASASAPLPIRNDGSFLEMFKKMQEASKQAEADKKPEPKRPALPLIGKRRGGRVLKTGLVKKAKAIEERGADSAPKDAWSLYMQEVKKYRETSCEEERKTRPLVK